LHAFVRLKVSAGNALLVLLAAATACVLSRLIQVLLLLLLLLPASRLLRVCPQEAVVALD
jgi:hypothetical protein